jgi:hypothetical protein
MIVARHCSPHSRLLFCFVLFLRFHIVIPLLLLLCNISQNRASLEQLLSPNPDALYELKQHVSLPLQTAKDATTGKPYVLSAFNLLPHGTYHRAASSNNNAMEAHSSELWDTYTQMYYGTTAVGSVHLLSEHPLQACFLLQNVTQEGQWNSIHIVNVKNTTITIQSTVLVMIGNSISAHVTRETSRKLLLGHTNTTPTMEMIGPLLEEVETNIRSSLEQVQLPKTRDILSELMKKKKSLVPNTTMGMNHTAMLNQAVLARAAAMQKKN